MEININEIASVKIKEMEESGEIHKRIEDGIEKTINDAIDSACKGYKFRSEISEKIEKILGEAACGVNLSAYANFLKDRMNEQIEKYVKSDMINLMRDSFEKVYFNMPEDIKLSDILNKYKEYLCDHLDADDMREWGQISFSFETEYNSFIRIKAGNPNKSNYGRYDKGIDINLYKPSSRDGKAVISWIRFNGKDFKTCMDLGRLSSFEILMFNLMFTQKEIEVDIDEDFCFDADFEDEGEDY